MTNDATKCNDTSLHVHFFSKAMRGYPKFRGLNVLGSVSIDFSPK